MSSCLKRLPMLQGHNLYRLMSSGGTTETRSVSDSKGIFIYTASSVSTLNFIAEFHSFCMHDYLLLTTDFRILTRGLGIGLEGLFSKLSGRVEEWPPFRACSAS